MLSIQEVYDQQVAEMKEKILTSAPTIILAYVKQYPEELFELAQFAVTSSWSLESIFANFIKSNSEELEIFQFYNDQETGNFGNYDEANYKLNEGQNPQNLISEYGN